MSRQLTTDQENFLIEYLDEFVAENVVSSMARRLWDKYSANRDLDGKWHTATDPRIREIINAIYDRAWRNMSDDQIERFERLGGYRIDPAGETRYLRGNPRDACYRKVKSRYKVWPSAYASGALVQCRKVGAGNWGVRGNPRFGLEKKYGLRGWFMRGGGKGWVDCKTGKTCGRQAGEKRKYPACRPTLAMCTSAARKKRGRKRISWVRENKPISAFISIHQPYADLIMSGKKTVETRYMRMSKKYMDKEIGVYVPEQKKIIGVVRVIDQIAYPDRRAFDLDYPRHLVGKDSPYYPKGSKTKIGLVLAGARRISPASPRGRPYGSTISKNPVPPVAAAKAACRGLAKRKKYRRGGTSVGVARARDLCNRRNLSKQTLARMRSYFARHRASKAESAKRRSDPTSAAAIADDLWGGTAGMKWANLLHR